MTEETETYEITEKKEITEGLREYISQMKAESLSVPLKRCSLDGVREFIAQEASSYSCKNVGTIENSIAKKAIDADLRTEIREIGVGMGNASSEIKEQTISHNSEISLTKIKDLLTMVVTKWVFQTTNSNVLKTFCAKSSEENLIEIFVNFENGGQRSYISFGGNYAGYIYGDTLSDMRKKLLDVFNTLTSDLSSTMVLWQDGVSKLEQIKLQDPDSWLIQKNEALLGFIESNTKSSSLLESFFSFFNFEGIIPGIMSLDMLDDSLNDGFATDFLLDKVTLDIKQVYA